MEKTNQVDLVKDSSNPSAMIELAVSKGANLEQLERLLNLRERYEANEAKKAYHKAMADFKAHAPQIMKDKKVGYKTDKGPVGYAYASLYNVVKKISVELSKYGLSASWHTQQNGAITVTCKITHILGHSEEVTISAPADTSGAKNAIQAIGSTIAYLERYTILAATGLAAEDMDDDGKSTGKPDVKMPEVKKAETPVELKNAGKGDIACAGCGIAITQAEKEYSEKKFKKVLCRNCQRVEGKRG